MAPQLPGGEPVDYGKIMGTVVSELQALVAVQREVHSDFIAALDVVQNFSPSRTSSRRARSGIKALAGGADPGAGQTSGSSASAGPGMLRLVDPGAGRLSGPTPRTVEDARAAAFGVQARQLASSLAGFPPSSFPGSRAIHFLAGTTARARAAGAGGVSASGAGAGSGGGPGGGGGVVPYVPGYGYYGGQGTPYLIGHGGVPGMPGGAGAGGGGGGGGIRPSGSGAGGHSSHLGLVGSIGSRVPVVGLAVRGVEEVLSQREKNAFYQNVEGGSNAGGFGERLSEEGYRWSSAGIFTSAEARQAFKGVTKIGYNGRVESGHGPGRQQALNFVYHGKSGYGATVDESLVTLQEAAKTPLTPLQDLSKALKGLSDDAGKAGENAQMARSQMVSLFSQALSGGYGSGAVSAASTISDTMASYGRSYADSSPAAQLTPGFGRYVAAQAGLTYGQYVSLQKTSPQQAANVRTGVGLQAIGQVLTPAMQQFIRAQITRYGGKVDESVSLQIASAFLSQFGRQVDPDVFTHQLSALSGIQFSDFDHALGWAVLQMAGNTEASRAGSAKPSSFTGVGAVSTSQAYSWGVDNPVSLFTQDKAANRGIHPAKGKVDPVLAMLASKVGDTKKEYVTVHTSAGPQVMRLDEAMATHPNELAAGQAQFVGTRKMVKDKTGKAQMGWAADSYSGQSISQVLGGQVDTSRSFGDESASASGADGVPLSKVPLAAQLAASQAATSAAGAARVTIDLSADARKLLTVVGATGTAGAAGEAAPPANPYGLNPSLSR